MFSPVGLPSGSTRGLVGVFRISNLNLDMLVPWFLCETGVSHLRGACVTSRNYCRWLCLVKRVSVCALACMRICIESKSTTQRSGLLLRSAEL